MMIAQVKSCICCTGTMKLKKRRRKIEFYWKCVGSCGRETNDAASTRATKQAIRATRQEP